MRDQAVRVDLCIPRKVVAKLARVSLPTVDRYELDPLAIRTPVKRENLGRVYAKFRELIKGDFLESETA